MPSDQQPTQVPYRRVASQQPEPTRGSAASWHGVTLRSVVLGSAMVVFICGLTPFVDLYLQGTLLAANQLPIGALFVFFLSLALLNPLLKLLRFIRPLSRRELLVTYCMMLVAAGIPSFGLVDQLLPAITAPFYYDGQGTYHKFMGYIPDRILADPAVSKVFYEGIPQAQRLPWYDPRDVPWSAWVRPLLYWAVLATGIYLVMFALCLFLRRTWIDREKLSFPLSQVPLLMVEGETREQLLPALLRDRMFWIGFAVCSFLYFLAGMTRYYPDFPQIPLSFGSVDRKLFTEPPLNAIAPVNVTIFPAVAGLSFMLSLEVTLSVWLFYLVRKGQFVLAAIMGYGSGEGAFPASIHGDINFLTAQGSGALLAFTLFNLWLAREPLVNAWQRWRAGTKGPAEELDASAEPGDHSWKWAVAFFVVGWALILGWICGAGMSPSYAVLGFVLFFLISLGLTRLVAEGGIFQSQAYVSPFSLMTHLFGSNTLGMRNLAVFTPVHSAFMWDLKSLITPAIFGNYKVARESRLRVMPLTFAMFLAVALSCVVSCVSFLWLTYKVGGVRLHRWFLVSFPPMPYDYLTNLLEKPVTPDGSAMGFLGLGAVVTLAFMYLRQRFFWWPHPLGYISYINASIIGKFWINFLLGWLVKKLVLKFGDLEVYKRVRNFFLGLILGQFTTAAIFLIVDLKLGIMGHDLGVN